MGDEYDFIVVGGGSAGCALAGRLSEDPALEVALVEAGPVDTDPIFREPALFWQQQKSAFDWDFETEPEPYLDGRRGYLPRGRVLGGTSAMNTMLYVRGAAADYDGWAAAGCDGWSFADVLPLFKRSEDNGRGESEFHGVGGPLSVIDAPAVPRALRHWVEAAQEAGHPANEDFNGAQQLGVGVYQSTQRAGERCSSAAAFIRPNLGRPNLTVLASTTALRLVWDGDRATGVEVECCGARRVIHAAREVALCAGAYLSPQLLMLSGIGPADHLRDHGIEVRVDNPEVGANLGDHAGCFITYLTAAPTGQPPGGWVEVGGFARTPGAGPDPDIQFHAAVGGFGPDGVAGDLGAISFGPYVCRPQSRGSVRLRSPLPQAKPLIRHNFLATPYDRDTLRDGVRMALAVARRPSLTELLRPESEQRASGLIPAADDDDSLDAYIRATAFSFYHPVGTCALGAVVEPDMRVKGVDGLRVCDASVLPTPITGNTNAPAIMVGEMAAARIRDHAAGNAGYSRASL